MAVEASQLLPATGVLAVVVSDVHLWTDPAPERVGALCRLVDRYSGCEIILAGDVFDLSLDRGPEPRWDALRAVLDAHPPLKDALRRHVEQGGRLTFLVGNHDTDLMRPGARDVLSDALGLSPHAALTIHPWFVRRGSVHVEHGHLYDSDNAPLHPLAPWSVRSEPLGVALMRRFVAANQAHQYAHANDTTPVRGLLSAFRNFRARAPLVIARYLATAAALCLEAGPSRKRTARQEREDGDARLSAYADEQRVPAESLRRVLSSVPSPRHLHARETFMRLYFDRICMTVACVGAIAALPSIEALAALVVSGGYVVGSVWRSGGRYQGEVLRSLREGAEMVARLTGAEMVVLGHSHVLEDGPHYVNSGSFGFPAGPARPYIVLLKSGGVERRFMDACRAES